MTPQPPPSLYHALYCPALTVSTFRVVVGVVSRHGRAVSSLVDVVVHRGSHIPEEQLSIGAVRRACNLTRLAKPGKYLPYHIHDTDRLVRALRASERWAWGVGSGRVRACIYLRACVHNVCVCIPHHQREPGGPFRQS